MPQTWIVIKNILNVSKYNPLALTMHLFYDMSWILWTSITIATILYTWKYSCYSQSSNMCKIKSIPKCSLENYLSNKYFFIKIDSVVPEIIAFKRVKDSQTSARRSHENLAVVIIQCQYSIHSFIWRGWHHCSWLVDVWWCLMVFKAIFSVHCMTFLNFSY